MGHSFPSKKSALWLVLLLILPLQLMAAWYLLRQRLHIQIITVR